MLFGKYAYRVLIVSSSDKMNSALKPLLTENDCDTLVFDGNITSARRRFLESVFDLVIINSPLSDEDGVRFAIDVCSNRNSVCLCMVRAENYSEIQPKLTPYGVFSVPKPTSTAVMSQAVQWMISARERLRQMEKKTVSLEEKMEEIRLTNRAKWILIDRLGMTEPNAHRYIEKQAMDQCVTKRAVAEDIIKTYS